MKNFEQTAFNPQQNPKRCVGLLFHSWLGCCCCSCCSVLLRKKTARVLRSWSPVIRSTRCFKTVLYRPLTTAFIHLPLILPRDGQLASCSVRERKRSKILKGYGDQATNANKFLSWERGISWKKWFCRVLSISVAILDMASWGRGVELA